MKSILKVAHQFYRAAQDVSAEGFEDVALAAFGARVRFGSALWFRGGFVQGEFQFHRLHSFQLPPEAVQEFVSVSRQFPRAIAESAASPGGAHVFHGTRLYGEAASRAALECVCRWGLERQMVIAETENGANSGEWLSLHRRDADAPFDQRDRALLRLLMPHLSQSRAVNRALSLVRASKEPFIAPGQHRALTLLDGTVLHCGSRLSDSIAFVCPDWDGSRLPEPLLRKLMREGSLSLAQRGESICARQFSDSLVLTVKSVPLADRLTRREHEIVQHFGAGQGYKEIAQRCGLAPATVRNIVQRSYRKLGINNKAQLARLVSRANGEL